jgi:hypothetical protein
MFAQVIQGGTATKTRDELNALVREGLIPALQDEPGFAGALSLFDRRGDGLMILLWDTEEQARRPSGERGGALLDAMSDIAALSTGPDEPDTVWEVGAKVVHTGSSRRLTGEPSL